MRRLLQAAAAAAVAMGVCAQALVQDYPNRTIALIVPYPPGGGVDAMGRVVAEKLSVALGQQVVVNNRAGGSALVGTRALNGASAASPSPSARAWASTQASATSESSAATTGWITPSSAPKLISPPVCSRSPSQARSCRATRHSCWCATWCADDRLSRSL